MTVARLALFVPLLAVSPVGAAALTYDSTAESFAVPERGFFDVDTGSEWGLDGLARSGPHAGRRLSPIADAYVSFWFAWAAFHPETVVWGGSGR